jgi:hypothetical protein
LILIIPFGHKQKEWFYIITKLGLKFFTLWAEFSFI